MPTSEILRAGPVQVKFQDGQLRYLCVNGREIVRRVYFAVRDKDFKTPMAELSQLSLVKRSDSFHIKFAGRCGNEQCAFEWTAAIDGSAEGKITFHIEGRANADFLSPRIGINMLIGTHLRGVEFSRRFIEATRPCGNAAASPRPAANDTFPTSIASPKWGFADWFDTLQYRTPEGVTVTAHFDGGHAGIEDQRNYGDTSYKVYGYLPYKYPNIVAGQIMSQTLTLDVKLALSGVEGSEVEGCPAAGDSLEFPKTAANAGTRCAEYRVRIGRTLPGARMPQVVMTAPPGKVAGHGFHTVQNPEAAKGTLQETPAAKSISWTYNPLVHLGDDDTLMENPPAVADQIRQARQWLAAAGGAITIEPIYIRFTGWPADSAKRTAPAGETCVEILTPWCAVMMKHLAEAGADRAVFALGSGKHEALLEQFAGLAGQSLHEVEICPADQAASPVPLPLEAFCTEAAEDVILWLINKTPRPQKATVDTPTGAIAFELAPYEVGPVRMARS